MFSLEVDGLEGWVPARLDADEATLRADLAERMSDYPPEAAGLVASVCWSRVESSRARNEPPLLAMWARFEDHRQTVPTAAASLQMVPVEPDATPLSFANWITEDFALYRPFELVDLPTKSGTAQQLVAISHEEGKEHPYARHDIVFWIRPADGEGMVLMTTTFDLVKGDSMARDLAQLAAGVQWGS